MALDRGEIGFLSLALRCHSPFPRVCLPPLPILRDFSVSRRSSRRDLLNLIFPLSRIYARNETARSLNFLAAAPTTQSLNANLGTWLNLLLAISRIKVHEYKRFMTPNVTQICRKLRCKFLFVSDYFLDINLKGLYVLPAT